MQTMDLNLHACTDFLPVFRPATIGLEAGSLDGGITTRGGDSSEQDQEARRARGLANSDRLRQLVT